MVALSQCYIYQQLDMAMAVTAGNTVHFNGDTFIIVKLTPEPHFIHIVRVLCLDDCKEDGF